MDLKALQDFVKNPYVNILETKSYLLKRKDVVIAKFEVDYDPFGFPIFKNFESILADTDRGPIPEITNNKDLERWVTNRFIPKNRRTVANLLGALPEPGLGRTQRLLDVTLCLSLVDDFWVVPADADYQWDNHSLFKNEFSSTLALIAFTGHGAKAGALASSPEFTTDGALRKCWRRIDGRVYLYKGGTEGYANAGLEPYSEMYASQVARVMGVDHVTYTIDKWKGVMCSVCEAFTSEDVSLLSAYSLFGNLPMSVVLATSKGAIRDSLIDMLIFDAVIVNSDRHFGNLRKKTRFKFWGIPRFHSRGPSFELCNGGRPAGY